MKVVMALVIVIVIALVVLFAIPLPSFQRSVVITNQLTSQVGIQCKTTDGKREKTICLSPGEQAKFVYFAGDHNGRMTIPVVIEATNLANGLTSKKQFDLPIDNQPPGLGVSEEWFKSKKE